MNMQVSQRIGAKQSMVVTGHLQQAIALLQLSNHDLQSYIEEQAEENPFIQLGRTERSPASLSSRGGGQYDGNDDITARMAERELSLYGHISAQFDMMFSNSADRAVADRFLEGLDTNGWLSDPLDEIAFSCGLTAEEAEDMLERIQEVEPTGLFARSLSECLRLQAKEKRILTPLFETVLENLPRLAAADLRGLCRIGNCSMDELKEVLKQLRGLDPKPGSAFDAAEMLEREPDLLVTRGASGWKVELNRSTLPTVLVDEEGAAALSRDKIAQAYIGDRIGTARWLRRAVEHRNQTALAVAAEIVRRQTAFLENGAAHIAPMTLAAVAQSIGVHESTVSRITTGTMMVTPQGTYVLKRFFSTALQKDDGEESASAAAVRHRIQTLVAAEDPKSPLSDDAISAIIAKEGPRLARRTVAKYRDMLKIPSSFQRRRAAKLAMN